MGYKLLYEVATLGSISNYLDALFHDTHTFFLCREAQNKIEWFTELVTVIVAFVIVTCISPCSWLQVCCFLPYYNICLEKSILLNCVPSLTLYGLFSICLCLFVCFLKREKTQIHHFIKKLEKAYSSYFCLGISVLISSLFKQLKCVKLLRKMDHINKIVVSFVTIAFGNLVANNCFRNCQVLQQKNKEACWTVVSRSWQHMRKWDSGTMSARGQNMDFPNAE